MFPCQLLHTLFFGCCSQLEFAPGHMACVSSSPPTHCSLWYKSSMFSALHFPVPWGGQFAGMVTIPPISYALLSCDFVPLPTERWSPLTLYLNLGSPLWLALTSRMQKQPVWLYGPGPQGLTAFISLSPGTLRPPWLEEVQCHQKEDKSPRRGEPR